MTRLFISLRKLRRMPGLGYKSFGNCIGSEFKCCLMVSDIAIGIL